MDARKLVLPAAVFVGGALLGRLIGFKGLMRAGVAALTVANVSESAGLLTAGKRSQKAVQRVARQRRPPQRKSASRRKSASAAAGTQKH
jgi:hypothetical protein